ncbi:unnamed protein product, partial [Candidula unifasciata]
MASFGQQLMALVQRNILLKKRNKSQIFQELLIPVYYVGSLALLNLAMKPETHPARKFPKHSLNDDVFASPFSGYRTLLVVPDSPQVGLFAGCSDDDNKYGASHMCSGNKQLFSGFVQLQVAIENVLMENLSISSGIRSRKISVQMMDRGEYSPDVTRIQIVTAITLIVSFAFIPTYLAVNIVEEKEKKIKDGMMMMGLRNSVFWLSWGIVYMMLITVASTIMVAIFSLSNFFLRSSVHFLFLCMILFGNSLISFAFMITPFFNKASTAGSVMISALLVLSLIYAVISQTKDTISNDSRLSVSTLLLLCLLSPVAFAMFIDQALYIDILKNGFDFNKGLTYGKFPLYASIVMMIVDAYLYAILTIYFDNVLPGKYRVGKHPLYFLQSSYWCPKQADMKSSQLLSPKQSQSKFISVEPVGRGMEDKVAMRILSLTKSFKQKGIILRALDNFCLDIYEGQITCLLGHNGAGKTTLINMLTGVIAPTSGSAHILGLDITRTGDLEQIRKKCGICPQHNILCDDLSCKEHLELFANIKGVPSHLINTTVQQALADVDLNSQSETFAKNLSGGQKRRLSVAIALIGDPKLLFLDEPSSSLDPLSRRHLWSLLKRIKEGKVVLLTTHFMDEADILADRKAFIRGGRLCCCGSSLFLKNKFGVGYHLTMVVEPNCNVGTVTCLLRSVIPNVKLTRSHGKEISYTVPLQDVSKFSVLFNNLDRVAESLGIVSYGVYMTTLEEVFFKLEGDESVDNEKKSSEAINPGFLANGHNVDADKPPSVSEANSLGENSEAIDPDLPANGHIVDADKSSSILDVNLFGKSTVHGRDLTRQRFWTLLKIRFKLKVRSILLVLISAIMPLSFVILGLNLIKMKEKPPVRISDPTFFNPFMYARGAGLPGPLPPSFLVFDAVNNNGSQAVISNWKRHYAVDTYLAGTKNTSDVAPHLIGIQIDRVIGQNLTDFTVLYNDSAALSIPVVINMVTQNILNSSNINVQINGSSLPWPSVMGQFLIVSMVTAILVAVCIILIVPTFTYDIVKERQFKLRSQLHISGVTFNVYWGTIYICDLLTLFMPVIGIIIAFFAIQMQGFNSVGALGALVLVVFTNVPLLFLLALTLSFLFDKAETCAVCMPVLLLLPTLIPYTLVPVVDAVHSDAAVVFHYVFCVILPPYIVFGGLYFISRVYLNAFNESRTVNKSEYFDFGNHVMICIIMPIIHMFWMYWLLRILDVKKAGGHMKACPCFFDWTDTSRIANPDVIDGEDEDITAERHRVEQLQEGGSEAPVAYVSQLRKVFLKRMKKKKMRNPGKVSTTIAVRNLSLGVDQGEVLGLLGPNGAGKSTVLNMMTAQVSPTCGKVVIDGNNICYDMSAVLDSLGYCPQDDPLWELITLEEHVECFADIKGIHPSELNKVVDYVVEKLKLEEHRKKPTILLSGGTKRK